MSWRKEEKKKQARPRAPGRVHGRLAPIQPTLAPETLIVQVKPVEDAYKFASFYGGSTLTPADFAARPAVLVCGAYSAGKTTFIRHLLGGKDYCGAHIGPEPTTDKFVVVHAGADERRTPGNTVVVQPDMPWAGLASFGSAFLSRFEAASCDARLLDEITLVDSPGVLAGEKQRVERGYDFVAVTSWLASRADLILVLFDPHKLDISDELKRVIASFQGNEEKVRPWRVPGHGGESESRERRARTRADGAACAADVDPPAPRFLPPAGPRRAQQGRFSRHAGPHARARRAHVVAGGWRAGRGGGGRGGRRRADPAPSSPSLTPRAASCARPRSRASTSPPSTGPTPPARTPTPARPPSLPRKPPPSWPTCAPSPPGPWTAG